MLMFGSHVTKSRMEGELDLEDIVRFQLDDDVCVQKIHCAMGCIEE